MPVCEKCKEDVTPARYGEYRGARLCISCELLGVAVVNSAFDDWLSEEKHKCKVLGNNAVTNTICEMLCRFHDKDCHWVRNHLKDYQKMCDTCNIVFIAHDYECETFCKACRRKCGKYNQKCEGGRYESGMGVIPQKVK